jgi:hypothetical protein
VIVNIESQKICKHAIMANLRYGSDICLPVLRKIANTFNEGGQCPYQYSSQVIRNISYNWVSAHIVRIFMICTRHLLLL